MIDAHAKRRAELNDKAFDAASEKIRRLIDGGQDIPSHVASEVMHIALEIFDKCGFARDFHATISGNIFGGTNRIYLRTTGWVASKNHCCSEFLHEFKRHEFGKIE
jgi:hypothetical protein|tara:strand:- start:272 stop:589 length:318 start_codon:yes stop_codon:yes gene_type:complete